MSLTPVTLARSETGRARAEVKVTPAASRLLDRLRGEGGGVVLILGRDLGDDVLCLGRRDVVLGPNAVHMATVRGCPIYVDCRSPWLAAVPAILLDVERDVVGLRFVIRVVDAAS